MEIVAAQVDRHEERIEKLEVRVAEVVHRQYETERLLAVSNEQQANMLKQLTKIDGHFNKMFWLVFTSVLTGISGVIMLVINNEVLSRITP